MARIDEETTRQMKAFATPDMLAYHDPNWRTNTTVEQAQLMGWYTFFLMMEEDDPQRKEIAWHLAGLESEYSKNNEQISCSICGKPLSNAVFSKWYFGHNPYPVSEGRCCDECEETFVRPARLALGKKLFPKDQAA